jgi:hypothetical protein
LKAAQLKLVAYIWKTLHVIEILPVYDHFANVLLKMQRGVVEEKNRYLMLSVNKDLNYRNQFSPKYSNILSILCRVDGGWVNNR